MLNEVRRKKKVLKPATIVLERDGEWQRIYSETWKAVETKSLATLKMY